jgi:lipopolysaccharide heptosyltransferase III
MTRVVAVRLDNAGDVLLTGPAVRALAAGADVVDLLVSPAGMPAAELLPGAAEVLVFDPPWSGVPPTEVSTRATEDLLEALSCRGYDEAVIFTSYHQSPLPMALLARLAGIPRIAASCDDYPGSLLDVRNRRMGGDIDDHGGPEGGHEVVAALALARAAGYVLPDGDDGRLAIRMPLPRVPTAVGSRRYVVVHPGATAPTRGLPPALALDVGRRLSEAGWQVVVTGSAGDLDLARMATPFGAVNLAGQTDLATLASVLHHADAMVVGNTGPAHLAAAVGTPVVSVFAPVVPVERWGPWQVPHRVLGDQAARCVGTRARECPVEGHPCLADVDGVAVLAAVREVAAIREVAAVREVATGRGVAAVQGSPGWSRPALAAEVS